MAENLKRYFSREDIPVANSHMERCSISLIIRKIQIKTIITLIRVAIKKSANNTFWRGREEKRILIHYWWECKLVHYGKQHEGSLEN